MAHLHDEGELLVLGDAFDGRTVEVGLFDNSVDAIAEDSTYADITTEPDGSDYTLQSVSNPSVYQNANEDAELDLGDISFDVSDATTEVDYTFVRDADTGDLIFTGDMEQTFDLGSLDILDLTNVGMTLE
ncbi:hypothetical protein [Natronoglomus mannanivorans]|uniref:Uncharacterized protein n=1 Tax=Natronoglomus mannanivorans TaxID=2979990 RepID=A0AAP2Z3D4_9EURY|nr:hypothetical protein [Halobacteria archaeon AArc-xg1-1]